MNNRIYGTVSIVALLAGNVASAGSPGPLAIIPAAIDPAAISDFNGFYAGAAVTSSAGDMYEPTTFGDGSIAMEYFYDFEGVGGAVYAGYNIVSSPVGFFYGGEIAYGMPAAPYDVVNGPAEIGDVDSLLTLHGRFGYVSGPLMYYGLAGYAMGEISCDSCDGYLNGTLNGYVAGAGVEYMITNSLSVRGQYEHFELSGAEGFDGMYDSSVDLSANVMSVGLNYHF